ncbi:mitochondrial acidic protein mam33-like [Cucurbita pepo subsp. pepo]|uniref:mitochondrial acidic protein mam33-like n=1 Tax=Cucurbita pepo subsp. pepo TaxID=3664 RepID=UPI000C9D6378|nr:mitochondrial acidic protein mam33-like [Cucurbita pepo subsp. pepo]XP_023534979.1 mitochondrial acidic protein mam33-like [Cucurbita pepo subsp. pepo]XP_023534980.1 mitochondrial acidic protein mam33-like [Cucurbita pepo subsp. pepo]XP_023534981.1 mitochondrial acidic protein mam33-like [Cucurbita pepo subsp. pepo]XP_023534982.1 mitochondrial acidic protein mam33-like [Cucurbita pepo subsp. pepo]
MAGVFRSAHRRIRSSYSKILTRRLWRRHCSPSQSTIISTSLFIRSVVSAANPKSPFDAITLRILRNEIEYQSDYAPPHLPAMRFNSFSVEDRPGMQWITLKGKFGGTEDIKIEATMFDGCKSVPKLGDDSDGEEDLRLHSSVLVDISKRDGSDYLEFVCSAWPDSLEIQKLYVLKRDRMLSRPYMGPDFRKLSGEIQTEFREFLAERRIDKELAVFLHEYMMNKDRCELIRWLATVKTFVER